jgi:simple sugar transport system permease protein
VSTSSIIESVATSAVGLMVPVLFAASGEAVGEQAGVLNIGIEGVMLIGAFTAAAGFRATGSLWNGFLLSIPIGIASGIVLWFLYVYRSCNQIVTGIMFNLFALGATSALYEKYLTGTGVVVTIPNLAIPGLAHIPGLGPTVFDQTPLFYIAVIGCVVLWYLLWKSWFGLWVRATGERPDVTSEAGLSVRRVRLYAVMIACTFAAVGGGALLVNVSGTFNIDMTAGQGFIALAIVILGRWNPLWIILGASLFGFADALQFQLPFSVPALAGVNHDVWLSLPYLVTIVVVIVAGSTGYPSATGVPFETPHARRRVVPDWWG